MFNYFSTDWFTDLALVLSFGRSSTNVFCTFSSGKSFSRCWAFYALLPFFDWKTSAFTSSNTCQLLATICHWFITWKVDTDTPRVGSWNRMLPIFAAILQCLLKVAFDNSNWVRSTSCHRGWHYSSLYSQCIFHMCLHKLKVRFLNISHKNWVWMVKLQLPSGCWESFRTKNMKEQSNIIVKKFTKKEGVSINGKKSFHLPKREKLNM